MKSLFGTDGVRGTANTYPMTADLALRRLSDAEGRFGLLSRDIVNIDLRVADRMIVRKRNESDDNGRDLFATETHVSTFFQDSSENSLTPDGDSVTL